MHPRAQTARFRRKGVSPRSPADKPWKVPVAWIEAVPFLGSRMPGQLLALMADNAAAQVNLRLRKPNPSKACNLPRGFRGLSDPSPSSACNLLRKCSAPSHSNGFNHLPSGPSRSPKSNVLSSRPSVLSSRPSVRNHRSNARNRRSSVRNRRSNVLSIGPNVRSSRLSARNHRPSVRSHSVHRKRIAAVTRNVPNNRRGVHKTVAGSARVAAAESNTSPKIVAGESGGGKTQHSAISMMIPAMGMETPTKNGELNAGMMTLAKSMENAGAGGCYAAVMPERVRRGSSSGSRPMKRR